jgi:hypothetical protein
MDPVEATISKRADQEQLGINVEGCRNALIRTMATHETVNDNDNEIAQTDSNNTDDNSTLLKLLPPPAEWIFVGRILQLERRQHHVRATFSVEDETTIRGPECSTLEYVFVCYINMRDQVDYTQQVLNLTSRLSYAMIEGMKEVDGRNYAREFINGEPQQSVDYDTTLRWKWASRSELIAHLKNEKSKDFQLDKKFKVIATKMLSLHNDREASPIHDFWLKSLSKPESFQREGIIAVTNDMSVSTNTHALLGDDRFVLYFLFLENLERTSNVMNKQKSSTTFFVF